uniref:ankyrin repeat domain-containing protein n=1 Tax=Longirhabdus pacifica TaxID=2305227 RepID=UPI001008D9E7
ILDNVNNVADENKQNAEHMIIINGYKLDTEHAPYYVENEEDPEDYPSSVFVPFVDTLEAFGGTVKITDAQHMVYTYQDQTSNIKIANDQISMKEINTEVTNIAFPVGDESERELNIRELSMQTKENVVYVSLDELHRVLPADIGWDDEYNIIHLVTENPSSIVEAVQDEENDLSKVKQLITNGSDVNARNSHGDPLLQMAIEKQNKELVKLLLDNKVDLNAELYLMKGQTLLDIAIKEGNTEILSMMLNATSEFNDDALFYEAVQAILDNNQQALQQVKNKGFDMNTPNKAGDTLLSAIAQWDKEAVAMVTELGANVDTLNSEGMTPLMQAAEKGNTEVVSYLLQKGANKDLQQAPKAYQSSQSSALMFAVYEGHKDTVQVLLDAGVNVDLQDINGDTALHMALTHHGGTSLREELALSLVNAGADGSKQNYFGLTALHLSPSVKLARAIIESDDNINLDVRNLGGYSALDEAVMNGNKEMQQLLLSKGATESDASFGSEALKSAVIFDGDLEKVKQLVNDGANVNIEEGSLLIEAIVSNNVDLVAYLIDQDIDVNAVNDGMTPLMFTFSYDDAYNVNGEEKREEVTKLLLQAGADVTIKGDRGSTALMDAAGLADGETIQMLLNAGAQVNVQDDYGNTALMEAARSANAEAVKVLLAANADPTLKTKPDERFKLPAKTALDYANEKYIRDKNYDETIKLLEEAMK